MYYFFTLSGYLIIRIIYKEIKHSEQFNFKQFYLRRVQRLYPVYYLVLIVGILLYHVVLAFLPIPFDINYKLGALIGSYVLFVPNVFVFYYPNVGGILYILWSIGIEEQFYLIMPLFLYLSKKRMKTAMGILLAIFLVILVAYPSFYRFRNFYFYFIAGGLASVWAYEQTYAIFYSRILQLMVCGLFIVAFFTDWLMFSKGIIYQLVNLLISTILIMCISDYAIFELDSPWLSYLGKISYGIYMYHFIFITGLLFAIKRFPIYQYMNDGLFIAVMNVIVISGAVAIAHCSYQYFEKRFYTRRSSSG